MGTAARTLDINMRMVGVSAVQSGFNQVRQSARGAAADLEHAGESAEGLSHSTIFGLGELSRGIGRIAESGQASGLAMRELSGGIMRLGASLGPGAGLIGIIAILGGVIVEHFMKAREEMKKTEEQFATSLGNMANAGQSTQLQRQTRDLLYGTPYDKNGQLQNPSAVSGAFQGSLVDLRSRIAMLTEQTRGLIRGGVLDTGQFAALDELVARAKPLEEQYQRLTTAILNVANQPASMSGLLPMKITAARTQMFAPGDASLANLLSGDQFKESALKHLLPGQIGDMNRPLIDQLKQELDVEMIKGRGATTTDERMAALKKYAEILKQIDDLTGKPGELGVLGGKGPKVAKITLTPAQADATKAIDDWNRFAEQIGASFATTLGRSIASGFEAVFSKGGGFSNGFRALGGAILEGFGGMLEQIGENALIGMKLIATIVDALKTLNPAIGIPAAIGLIAFGAALKGAGGSMASNSSGGGGYGGSSYAPLSYTGYVNASAPSAPPGAGITPKSATHNYFTVIGPNDPTAQRTIDELIRKSNARGSLR